MINGSRIKGVNTALSVLLLLFRNLPRVCYYDNACNMLRSIFLGVPWINGDCLIACDRFLYRGRTCNSIRDPGSYRSYDGHGTSGAESENQLLNFSKSHLPFLHPYKVMPFFRFTMCVH